MAGIKEPRYIQFTWDDREQLRGRWIKFKDSGSEILINELHPSDKYGIVINDYSPSLLLEAAIFVDTGEPVGKRVED